MLYEVELKFPLESPAAVLSRLEDELEADRGEPVAQSDVYFNHPLRDFAQTDEALRVRSVDGKNSVTYKGAVIDPQAKIRREIEIPFGESTIDGKRFVEMLDILGFREVRTVRKTRVPYEIEWEDLTLEVAFDEVDGLGTFLEIETIAADDARGPARDAILRLAQRLGLDRSERRSYLQLLLEKEGT